MKTFQSNLEAELQSRQNLKNHIHDLIMDRCTQGHGRIQRGALHLYLYHRLGFIGHPGKDFAKYINKCMKEYGYRTTYLVGKRCYYGLSWKGEVDWLSPQASDIPVWMDNHQKFDFRALETNVSSLPQ